jgi:hypothetical protein
MKWRARVDSFLQTLSWDETLRAMEGLMGEALARKGARKEPASSLAVPAPEAARA